MGGNILYVQPRGCQQIALEGCLYGHVLEMYPTTRNRGTLAFWLVGGLGWTVRSVKQKLGMYVATPTSPINKTHMSTGAVRTLGSSIFSTISEQLMKVVTDRYLRVPTSYSISNSDGTTTIFADLNHECVLSTGGHLPMGQARTTVSTSCC